MEIYVLRHCKTINNINNSWSGCKADVDLSPEGEKRNEEIIKELSQIKFDVIFSSPLKRCLATSEKLSKITNTKLIIDNRLIERDFGILEGKACVEEDKLKLADFNLNTDLNSDVERIQTMYEKRILPFYNELLKKDYKRVLVVTHSWIVRLSKYFFDGNDPNVIAITPKNGTYQKFVKNNIVSRSFNSVKIVDDKIIKKSLYTQKFNDEIKWMISLPKDMIKYIPKIYDYHISKNNEGNDLSYIVMQYINEKSFEQFYLNKKLSEDDINIFFNQVSKFLNLAKGYVQTNISQQKIKEYLYDVYYKKTVDRWNFIKDDPKFSSFHNYEIVINNKKFKPVKYYLENLEKTLKDFKVISDDRKFWIIHGDLCFNNIIFKDNNMYVIDPRGSFGEPGIYGDYLYELAKISHSISGYDSITNNYFSLNFDKDKNSITYEILKLQNKEQFVKTFEKIVGNNILHQVYLIESLLFLSMIPLHSENYNHQVIMLALALEKLSNFIK